MEVGNALLAIRDGKLYKEAGYTSFEKYCQERWGWSRATAYRSIDSARVAAELSPTGDNPIATERQARELAPLLSNPDKLREVTAKLPPAPTAKVIRAAVAKARTFEPTEEPAFPAWAETALMKARNLLREASDHVNSVMDDADELDQQRLKDHTDDLKRWLVEITRRIT